MILSWFTFSFSWLFEAASWFALLSDEFDHSVGLYALFHVIATVLLLYSVLLWLSPALNKIRLSDAIIVAILLFGVPFLGFIGFLFAVFLHLYYRTETLPKPWQIEPELATPPLRYLKMDLQLTYTDGGLYDILRFSNDIQRKVSVVLATRLMPDTEAIPILKIALKDPQDDVRLLAYSLLEKKEDRLNKHIQSVQKKLLKSDTRSQKQNCLRALASSYWDLAYLGLAEQEMQRFVLDKAVDYAKQSYALEANITDSLLIGRVMLKQNHHQEAHQYFSKALNLGIDRSKVLPYLAEIAYQKKAYHEVSHILSEFGEHSSTPFVLTQISDFWCKQ